MARGRASREMDCEAFNAWSKARDNNDAVIAAAAEQGGPRVSLVPVPDDVPLDFLPDSVDAPAAAASSAPIRDAPAPCSDAAGDPSVEPFSSGVSSPTPAPAAKAVPFEPEPSRKAGGWSAERQRLFIQFLAETGSVHLAAKSAGLSARAAYQLRIRSAPFARAWDAAQQLAVGRLSALAFDRAIHGRIEQVYRDGDLVGERRVPSDRLLMWLLVRLDPQRFAAPWERRADDRSDPQAEANAAFPALIGALTDTPEEILLPQPSTPAPHPPTPAPHQDESTPRA